MITIPGSKRGGDYYVHMGISHPFELTKEVVLTPGIIAGYYYNTTAKPDPLQCHVGPGRGRPGYDSELRLQRPDRTITLGGVKQTRTP